jgi:hypothetical protein
MSVKLFSFVFKKQNNFCPKMRWFLQGLSLSSHPDATAKLLGSEFHVPKILVPLGEKVDSLFEAFVPRVYSSEGAWLEVRWESRVVCERGAKWEIGSAGELLNVNKLYSLALEAERWNGDELTQTWLSRYALNSDNTPLKEISAGWHPKAARKTLWFFFWEGVSEDIYRFHVDQLKQFVPFFDTMLLSLALDQPSREAAVAERLLRDLGCDAGKVHIVAGHNKLILGEVPHFLEVIKNPAHHAYLGDIVLYAHSKGSMHPGDRHVLAWTELMYKFCVANWDTMLSHVSAKCGGAFSSRIAFQRAVRPSPLWHYTGNFVWYKPSSLLGSVRQLDTTNRWGVEKLAGYMDPMQSDSLIFYAEVKYFLYSHGARIMADFWRKLTPLLDNPDMLGHATASAPLRPKRFVYLKRN